jgi:hypothetical protein
MKKVLLALILVASAFVFFGTGLFAAEGETGNLVVHFKAWDDNYESLGSWGWDGLSGKLADGVDDFGAYWVYNDIAIDGAAEMGFIAVYWDGEAGPNWGKKLTGDIKIARSVLAVDQTVHVYVFSGIGNSTVDNPGYFVADPDTRNVLVVYYDPANAYEETLGIHAWGWNDLSTEWGTPAQVFSNAGVSEAGIPVKAAMLSNPAEGWAGFLIYAGGDPDKKTGDVTLAGSGATLPGDVGFAFVVSKGNAYTAGDNVFYNNFAGFAEEAFSFKLMPYNADDKSGTYAVDPNTIIVKLSANVTSPYATAAAADKDDARALIESWFAVHEVISAGVYGEALEIERVDFAGSNPTLNAFVIILADGSELDNTKQYEVFFDLGLPVEDLEVAKDVLVTVHVTVPANTPAEAVIRLAGSVNGWNPGDAAYTAVQIGETNVYALTFTVSVTEKYTNFAYKWTRGSWPTEEFVASDRLLVIPNTVDSIVFKDVVLAWADIDAPSEKYAAPVRTASVNQSASIMLDMDSSKPVLTFIAPTAIVGLPAAQRIITVAWGQPFNVNQFPRYRALDDRDGDVTAFIYVPKGEFSILDTRTEGDYTIMLRVVDRWGNATEETFIFRVAKSA